MKSAESPDELIQALALRQEVFQREFCGGFSRIHSDFDELDIAADHLIVVHHPSGRVIGNYRLLNSQHSNHFYSQSEFLLSEFLSLSGDKLELSRSCVHSEYRCGIVMQLLWRGVIEYMRTIGAHYLFGCTSVKTLHRDSIARLAAVLDSHDAFTDRFGVEPLPHCRFHDSAAANHGSHDTVPVNALLPPIMRAYLKAGAKLCRRPAIDPEFQCTDFLTILDPSAMRGEYARKYLG